MISLPDRLNTRRSLRSCHHRSSCNNGCRRCSTGPIAFAHRGARAHARENTLEAFALALRLGATGLESDVWLTADGVPVLDHDGVVRLGRRKRSVARRCAATSCPTHIPTLAELLAALRQRLPPLARPQGRRDAGPAVIDVVRERGAGAAPRLWLCAPRRRACWPRCAPLDDDVRLVNSTRLARIKEGPERRAATLRGATASTPSTSTTPTGPAA